MDVMEKLTLEKKLFQWVEEKREWWQKIVDVRILSKKTRKNSAEGNKQTRGAQIQSNLVRWLAPRKSVSEF